MIQLDKNLYVFIVGEIHQFDQHFYILLKERDLGPAEPLCRKFLMKQVAARIYSWNVSSFVSLDLNEKTKKEQDHEGTEEQVEEKDR